MSRIAIEDSNADLDFGDLAVEAPRNEALAKGRGSAQLLRQDDIRSELSLKTMHEQPCATLNPAERRQAFRVQHYAVRGPRCNRRGGGANNCLAKGRGIAAKDTIRSKGRVLSPRADCVHQRQLCVEKAPAGASGRGS